MKKQFTTIIILVLITHLFFFQKLLAQAMPEASIGELKRIGEFIEFNIVSTKPFYVGANNYYLQIGNQVFEDGQQLNIDGKGFLKFLLPSNEYDKLKDGENIIVSYGRPFNINGNETKQELYNSDKSRCKFLGTFLRKNLK